LRCVAIRTETIPPLLGVPITALQITNAVGIPLSGVVQVSRNASTQFGVVVNQGSSPHGVIWTLTGSSMAMVDQNGLVVIADLPSGILTLTAWAPCGTIFHSIALQVVAPWVCVHEYERIVTPPTCTSVGFTTFVCIHCSQAFIGEAIEAGCNVPGCEICDPQPIDCGNCGVCPICDPATTHITTMRIADTNNVPLPIIVQIPRNASTQFTLNLNPGASPAGVLWTLTGSALAAVDNNGLVTVLNLASGILMLTARDPITGVRHTIALQVV